jgi:hypothetical protein
MLLSVILAVVGIVARFGNGVPNSRLLFSFKTITSYKSSGSLPAKNVTKKFRSVYKLRSCKEITNLMRYKLLFSKALFLNLRKIKKMESILEILKKCSACTKPRKSVLLIHQIVCATL